VEPSGNNARRELNERAANANYRHASGGSALIMHLMTLSRCQNYSCSKTSAFGSGDEGSIHQCRDLFYVVV